MAGFEASSEATREFPNAAIKDVSERAAMPSKGIARAGIDRGLYPDARFVANDGTSATTLRGLRGRTITSLRRSTARAACTALPAHVAPHQGADRRFVFSELELVVRLGQSHDDPALAVDLDAPLT